MKKVNECPNGSYVQLQQRLLSSGTSDTCNACEELLMKCNFNPSELESLVERALGGDADPFAIAPAKAKEPKEPQGDAAAGDPAEASEEEADDNMDPLEYLAQFEFLQMLKSGEHGKRLPCRCRLCPTKASPDGKVFELSTLKLRTVKHFVASHCGSAQHLRGLAIYEREKSGQKPDTKQVPCAALQISDAQSAGNLYHFRAEFETWASMSNLKKLAAHCYWRDGNGEWFIRSSHCLREIDEQPETRHICSECLKLGGAHAVARTIARFSMKFNFARLLSARPGCQ